MRKKKQPKLTVADIRAMAKQLKSLPQIKEFKLPLGEHVRLSASGVVVIGDWGFMHPETFKNIAGEEGWKVLLSRPRVITEYDVEGVDYIIKDKDNG